MVEAIKGIFRWIKNFFFCLKYPFWKSTNVWTGDSLGYSYTWYDDIPEGYFLNAGSIDDVLAKVK